MEFIKLDIYTESAALEPLTDKLTGLGVSGFEIHDAADFGDFLQSGVKNWDYIGEELDPLKFQPTYITLYLPSDSQGTQTLQDINSLLNELRGVSLYGDLRIEQNTVREEDWANCWKEYFKPFDIGKTLLIKPTWEPQPQTDRIVLEIDPASAFGTGQHESTRLCLEALEEVIESGCAFLDLGCGSGILTAAALLLGAQRAVMVDVSENAVRTACENVEHNGFTSDKYTAFCGDITEDDELLSVIGGGFFVIAANIVADVIIKMSGIFPRLLKKGGKLVVSGIIKERVDEVAGALRTNGFSISEIKEDNGWCAVLLNK